MSGWWLIRYAGSRRLRPPPGARRLAKRGLSKRARRSREFAQDEAPSCAEVDAYVDMALEAEEFAEERDDS